MSILNVIGAMLLASPFVLGGVHIVRTEGWRELGIIYGSVFSLVAVIALGAYLVAQP